MFNEKLAQLRKKNNLSQADLANELGFSSSTVAMWEIGKREPNITTIKKIAEYFDVSIDYLLGYDRMEDDLKELENVLIKNGLKDISLEQALKIIDILKKDSK